MKIAVPASFCNCIAHKTGSLIHSQRPMIIVHHLQRQFAAADFPGLASPVRRSDGLVPRRARTEMHSIARGKRRATRRVVNESESASISTSLISLARCSLVRRRQPWFGFLATAISRDEIPQGVACFQRQASLRAANALSAGTNAAKHISVTATQIMNWRSMPVIESGSTEKDPTKP
jgi:hypothetical protein